MSLFSSPNPPQYNLYSGSGRTAALQQAATGTFNPATGLASVMIGPTRARQSWTVTRLSSLISPAILVNAVPQLWVYRNMITPSSLIDSTTSADQATSETNFTLYEGEQLICNWELQDANGNPIVAPGQNATIVVTGTVNY